MRESVNKLATLLDTTGGHQVERLTTTRVRSSVDSRTKDEWPGLADLLHAQRQLYELGLRAFRDFES